MPGVNIEATGAAFPTLSRTQISLLENYGAVRETEAGQVLFQEGDTTYDFIVILEGDVKIVENFGGEARTIATHGARRFLGEMKCSPDRPYTSPPSSAKRGRCWLSHPRTCGR